MVRSYAVRLSISGGLRLGSSPVTNYFLTYGHRFDDGGGQWLIVYLADASAGTRAEEIANSLLTVLYEGMYGRENMPAPDASPQP